MVRNQQTSGVYNPIRIIAVACAVTVGVLVWLGWSIYDSDRVASLANERLYRIEVLRGRILHLDEVLTMSARMGATTGDLRWEERYHTFEPQLDAAIQEAIAISPEAYSGEGAAETNTANIVLVGIETRAFDLVRQGQAEMARELLFGAEYEQQKRLYALGMVGLEADLKRISAADSRSRERGAITLIAAVVLVLLMTAGGWLAILRVLRKWQARLVESNQHLVASGRDLAELNATLDRRVKDQTSELRAAIATAECANAAKTQFLANMSHEIRTPMTAILGFAENLQDSTLSESERRNCADTIRRNGEALLGIINDILDLSKIEAGKMDAERVSCEPCGVIAEAVSLVGVQARAKGLPVTIQYEGAIPETIHTDPARLRQILINLLGNAIKFTETGTVRLATRLVDDGDAPLLQFDVIDTGQGITEQSRANLFQPFMQADASATRRIGGTGLGLAISKRFAEMLGGDVTVVATEIGVGSTFRATVATGSLDGVRLLDDPMSVTVVADIAPAIAQVQSDLQGCRILLAEDGPDNQRLISFLLKKAGADVTVEENGQLAIDAAMAARRAGTGFDVILMDMQMPVMDGYEATVELRRKGYTGPIIALTAHAMAGDREKCIKAGCNDYATKPVDRKKLIEAIQCQRQRAQIDARGEEAGARGVQGARGTHPRGMWQAPASPAVRGPFKPSPVEDADPR